MITEESLGEKLGLSVETIKPVHIRGEKYTFFNLFYDKKDNKICIADYSKSIDEKLAVEILGNEFENILRMIMASAKPECIRREYVLNKAVPVKINDVDVVDEMINNYGITMIHPLMIPPSTIKGVLRTALIYYVLDSDDDLRRSIEVKIEKKFIELKKQKKIKKNDLKKLSRKMIESEINNYLRKIILKNSENFDFGYLIGVKFSQPPKVETFIGYLGYMHIGRYKDDRLRRPELVEFLVPGTTISYNVWTRKVPAKNPNTIPYGKKPKWFEDLFQVDGRHLLVKKEALHNALRLYATKTMQIARETICEGNKGCTNIPDSPQKNDCYLVRIGYGSSHIYKTIRSLIEESIYERYIEHVMSRVFSKKRKQKWDLSTDKLALYWEDEEKKEESVGWSFLCLR